MQEYIEYYNGFEETSLVSDSSGVEYNVGFSQLLRIKPCRKVAEIMKCCLIFCCALFAHRHVSAYMSLKTAIEKGGFALIYCKNNNGVRDHSWH